jgi:serine/threonine protein phosphatase PrpC
MAKDMMRAPTFLVGTEKQRGLLDEFQRRDQHFTEEYQKNKPLCFSARSYQKTHPGKMKNGHKDADATLASPMLLGVADGVSQLEEFGMDASELPNELLRTCEELAMSQLIPDRPVNPQDAYRGPVSLLKEAYEGTESLGSTTVLLAVLDNSTRIHGKLHPMVAVLTIGDCELLMLRRLHGRQSPLQAVFHTEMQRIDGHVQTPLQLARVDDRVDPEFDEELALEVIERGSAVHCVSAYEGDIIVLGSDGVFDNLFLDEVVDICNEAMSPKPGNFVPTQPAILSKIAKRIVEESHAKSQAMHGILPDTPIGRGGKMDDTSVVVGEVVEWTQAHSEVWAQVLRKRGSQWNSLVTCGGMDSLACRTCRAADDSGDEYEVDLRRNASRESGGPYKRSADESMVSDDEDDGKCSIQ